MIYWLPNEIGVADVPGKIRGATTIKQIRIDTNAPQHPGRYCQLGCIGQLFNFGDDALWERLESDRRQRETASLIFSPASHKDTPLKDFKIYLDGYIRTTAPRDRDNAPKHCVYLEFEPGDHAIVVRDYDHLSPNRRESNTVLFRIEPHQQAVFSLSLSGGHLHLQVDGC